MSFFTLLKAEFKALLSDMDVILTIFGGVLLYSFLYPQPYLKESVTALPVAVVDNDKSDLSRKITYMLDASPQIKVDSHYLSEEDAKKAIINNKVTAMVIIPSHFKRDLLLGKEPVISVGADASYFLIYGGVVGATMHSVLTQSAQQQVGELLKKSVPLITAKMQYTPFKTEFINTFNVSGSYINYVLPAVFILILQQTMLIGMAMMGALQNEKSKRGVHGYYDRESVLAVMGVRYLSFGFIYAVHILFFFGFSFSFFGVPHIAKIGELLLYSFSFLIAVGSLGIFLGSLFRERIYPTPVILLSSLPLVFTAGFVWPLEMMPQWLIWLSNLSPSTPGIQGFLRLNQMGADFSQVIDQFGLLWLQTVVYGFLAYLVLRAKSRKIEDDH
jgi:ABC-2 type transport system permease protein